MTHAYILNILRHLLIMVKHPGNKPDSGNTFDP
jgi:hypothetical protein